MKKVFIGILILATACTNNNQEKNTPNTDNEKSITLCRDSVFSHSTSKGKVKHLRVEIIAYNRTNNSWGPLDGWGDKPFKTSDQFYHNNGLIDSVYEWELLSSYESKSKSKTLKYRYFGDTMSVSVTIAPDGSLIDTTKIINNSTVLQVSYLVNTKRDTMLTDKLITTYKNCKMHSIIREFYKMMDGRPTLSYKDTLNKEQIEKLFAREKENNEINTSYDDKGNILQSYTLSGYENGDSTKIINNYLYHYYN